MTPERRKLIFDAAKRRGAVFKTLADVRDMDAAIDVAVNDNAENVVTAPARSVDLDRFFAAMRAGRVLGPTLSQSEVDGCKAIIAACEGWPVAWTAYALATAYHETAGTMQPIREYGRGKGRKYGKVGKYPPNIPFGRGYVQLTWDFNYELADEKLGLNGALLKDFDLALDHAIAAQIMVRGMKEGWFTRKKLADFLPTDRPATLAEFTAARPIINGTDKAQQIARHALEFQKGLMA